MKKPFHHGLVIGKFYPPQAGHHHLIRAAARASERVTVVAMPASIESIPMEARLAWLREAFHHETHVRITGIIDDVRVDYDNPGVWEAHVSLMRQAIATVEEALPAPQRAGAVDAVFTSEHYGEELGRRLNATSVVIDLPRHLFPVSGTAVRASPLAFWEFLAPSVRAWLCHRVVVVGAESSGTTTLSHDLAAHYRQLGGPYGITPWVAEYGREYSHDKLAIARALDRRDGREPRGPENLRWESDEFVHIACEQTAREEAAAKAGSPIMICDTDAFATGIWHERYMGRTRRDPELEPANLPRRLLYILTAWKDVPFEQDGLRDGRHIRGWMHDRFAAALDAHRLDWIEVAGNQEHRLHAAVAAIEQRRCGAWKFTEPLG